MVAICARKSVGPLGSSVRTMYQRICIDGKAKVTTCFTTFISPLSYLLLESCAKHKPLLLLLLLCMIVVVAAPLAGVPVPFRFVFCSSILYSIFFFFARRLCL